MGARDDPISHISLSILHWTSLECHHKQRLQSHRTYSLTPNPVTFAPNPVTCLTALSIVSDYSSTVLWAVQFLGLNINRAYARHFTIVAIASLAPLLQYEYT
jgi:hypothetical protein